VSERIRLVALDLDGTLLIGNRVSDGNAAAVREAVAAGVHIVFATSRWYLLAKRTADALGMHSPIICHNGAMIRDADGSPLLELKVAPDQANAIAALADVERYETFASVGDVTYLMSRREGLDPSRLPGGLQLTGAISPHVAEGCEAFLFFGDDAIAGIRGRFEQAYGETLNFAWGYSSTFPPYLNIVNRQADKGRALAIVCERLGVPLAESMAIGDAQPDLEMMRPAGVSIAMGNAPDDVKAQATDVAPGNLDDGVAWAIRKYCL
jgi:Cof subfamily protein (haloacid dehalogenase superfamily)